MDPSTETSNDALTASVPLFDRSRLPLRSWCVGSREDPLTGLIAFPDFHLYLPRALATELENGGMVGLAIGDVDGLKEHVETANATDSTLFGHLAGNQVMARLGAITRTWFHGQNWDAACAATFGGDEVIIAASVTDPATFHRSIATLRDLLADVLPTRVSFALAVAGPEHLPAVRDGNRWPHALTDQLLAGVDRALFAHKAVRRAGGGSGGIIAVTEPLPAAGPRSRSLLPLPTGDDELHVLARPSRVADQPVLLIPCNGPEGLRGLRFRVTYPDVGSRTEVLVSAAGQAALPIAWSDRGAAVPLILRPIRPPAAHSVPDDLAAALSTACLNWQVLPEHERAQMLHLVTESADSEIRAARIDAAVEAVRFRSPS